ncbi:alpha-glucosidase [Chitinophaga dinghuensis]|uniref:Alpha-glucosidase n=1 Tax=Chitinophaga dinghuensis TaxID=1539050 RepID=A0A327VQ78_9BACT|nr:glycoside hydrolase family 97 protein [Chitinophaga dinghuensis]RAJ76596.1 alpha-glucosidase [Chitinophaga dinghuensis]
MYRLFLLLASLFTSIETIGQSAASLSSPDGKVIFRLAVTDSVIHYDVAYQQQPTITTSVLGVEGWQRGLKLQSVRKVAKDEWWKPVYGERNRIRDHYQALIFTFIKGGAPHATMQIEARAYNEGIAIRYTFPTSSSNKTMAVSQDLTEFSLPAGTKAWFTGRAQGAYQLLPMDKWPGEAERPLTLQLPNGIYAALAEAAVVDYCRTKFILHPTKPNTIACSMYDKVQLPVPFATPWRVIMLAAKATDLLQNDDLLLNLNAPCAIPQTAWIKPGKVMREMSLSTAGAKQLVDFAVKRHLQYIHFDAGWYGPEEDTASDATHVNVDPARNPVNDLNMQEVVQYAKQKRIGVWVYVNKKALGKQLDSILPLYEKWGIAGVKFGFVNVGSFEWTKWLHDAVKKCAKYHLMVDIHDEYRPTGFSRTYPNLLTQEGIRGNEEMPDATHNTVLPFTRFLCGAADYTICYYHRPELKKRLAATQNKNILKTTSVHQMALSVVYYSPLQFMYWYDKPEDSQDEPELDFFDRVPTVWEDTKVLAGEIGQYVTIARRNNNNWFVGSITNNDGRDTHIPCSFLTPGKKYRATIYYDDPSSPVRTKVSVRQVTVDANSVLDAHLLPSGGQAVFLTPIN